MRAFIAINFDSKDYFMDFQSKLKELSDSLNVRYTLPKSFHLTLKFLGDIDDSKVRAITAKLKGIKFSLSITKTAGLGFFPDEDYIRIVWIGLENADAIIKLQKDIDEKLGDLFQKDLRFMPHLTLERIKFIDPFKRKKFVDEVKKIAVRPKDFAVDSFELVESALTPDGPVYKVLESFSAKGQET